MSPFGTWVQPASFGLPLPDYDNACGVDGGVEGVGGEKGAEGEAGEQLGGLVPPGVRQPWGTMTEE